MSLNLQFLASIVSLLYYFRIYLYFTLYKSKNLCVWSAPKLYYCFDFVGFTKDQMKIELLDMSRKLRITGERPIPGNKWRKFDQTYSVPENSEAEKLEAKFEQGTLILKMQKKPISQSSQVAPQQEVEKSPSNNKDLDEAKVEKAQETNIPSPQSTNLEESTKDMKSDSPQTSQSIEKKTQNDDDTSSQIPQKGQQEFEPKPTSKDTTNDQIDEKSQKGQEEFETRPTSIERAKTQIDEKPQNGQQVLESKPTSIERTKTQTNEKAQKGEEEVEPKTIEKLVTKENLEEKIVGMSAEDAEKERNSKKEEVEEKNEKTYESSKNQNLEEKEVEKAEPSAPNVPEKEKESCCRIPPNQEGKNGIRKFAATSSQFVTRIAEGKLSGEEKHLVENVGAAVLVIAAFGAYVSYWFSS